MNRWAPYGVPLYSVPTDGYGVPLYSQPNPYAVPLYSTPPRVGAAEGAQWAPAPADLAVGGAVGFIVGLIIGRLL